MKNNIYELLAPCITNHLEETVYQRDDYRNLVKESSKIFEQLGERLEPENAKLLDNYFSSLVSIAALCEELVYTQGMKDLLALLTFLTV